MFVVKDNTRSQSSQYLPEYGTIGRQLAANRKLKLLLLHCLNEQYIKKVMLEVSNLYSGSLKMYR